MLQNAKKALANPEPSTHGTKLKCPASPTMSAAGVEADLAKRWQNSRDRLEFNPTPAACSSAGLS
jgi:hypothetical protein